MSSSLVTLFSEQKIAQAGSPSMFASVAAHFVTAGLLFVLVKVGVPHVVHVPPQEFSVVRMLTYNPSRNAAKSGSHSTRYQAKNTHAIQSAGGAVRPQRRVLPPNPKIKTGPQTILQAHANHIPPPAHAVIPTVLLTSANPKITQRIFTPPPHPNPAAPTPQLLTLPNAETHVADIMLSSTAFTTPHLVLPPSTTVPYKLDHPTLDAQIVETSSPTKQAPTPTRLLAISDLQVVKGTIAIPQSENEVQKTAAKGSLTSGEENNSPGTGAGYQAGLSVLRAALAGSGTNGRQTNSPSVADSSTSSQVALQIASAGHGRKQGTHGLATTADSPAARAVADSGSGNQISFTHLSKPKTGQFGAILMGDSPEQDFPETADLWVGRNVFTVYVNVGTRNSWILQYSLPKSATPAQMQGKLNAPYPYDLLRPNFSSSALNADDLLVHGFIDADGKLNHLSVEFPPDFTLAKLVMKALAQWQFRPATLNGSPTVVEILLIIPNHPD
jgi:hypothetical protein